MLHFILIVNISISKNACLKLQRTNLEMALSHSLAKSFISTCFLLCKALFEEGRVFPQKNFYYLQKTKLVRHSTQFRPNLDYLARLNPTELTFHPF